VIEVLFVQLLLMTSCHVSLNPNIGPTTAQAIMIETAKANVAGWPAA
jgi:hypothetical protein